MKRLLWALLLSLLLIPTATFADSVRFGLSVNTGGGDNFGFIQQSGGILMGGEGGTPLGFFDSSPGYRPGDPFGGDAPIFFSSGGAIIGGITYDVLWSGGVFVSPFTFPTNGKDFRVPVTVGFSANGTILDTGELISAGGAANGYISFFVGIDGLYYPGSDFIPVPEPNTLALVGTGMMSIFGINRVRKHERRMEKRKP
jgi:PEP-CTERM motif